MRIAICAAALVALGAGAALAKEPPNARSAAKDAVATETSGAPKTLYVCEDNALTRRGFAREFGQMEFVTAKDARADGEAWSAPKCITGAEARKLKALRLSSTR